MGDTDQAHQVHGMGLALEAPVWPAITIAEASAVLSRFPEAGALSGLDWHSPRPFSAATLLRTDKGALFLKRHHQRVRTARMLAEEHRFMAHVRSRGVIVPGLVQSDTGATAIGHGEWSYELYRTVPGEDLYRDRQSWTPFLTQDHAHAAGVALGRLHQAAQGFADAARGSHPLVASFTIVPASDPMSAAEAYIAARPALAAFLARKPWQQGLAQLFAALADGLSGRLTLAAPLWTHNDWHPSNLLWSADSTVGAVFDFGLATQTCALHDLATAIERTAIGWLGLPNAPTDVAGAQALLAGYRSLAPLTDSDLATVVKVLPLVHLEFALSEVDYFAGVLDDAAQAERAWHDYALGHAEWFLSRPGQDFLAHLQAGALA